MAYFITRVELHSAKTSEDYAKLHIEMGKEGFSTTIKSDTGEFKLPTASYLKIGNFEIVEVIESAKRAASKVVPSFEVLTTQAAEVSGAIKIRWYNLIPVK